jgi:hypothetical protein
MGKFVEMPGTMILTDEQLKRAGEERAKQAQGLSQAEIEAQLQNKYR